MQPKKLKIFKAASIAALVILKIYFRDCVQELLLKNCENLECFEWAKHIKFFIKNEDV
jgi:ascorbate-specific PTS system EIIC-type component UlaA